MKMNTWIQFVQWNFFVREDDVVLTKTKSSHSVRKVLHWNRSEWLSELCRACTTNLSGQKLVSKQLKEVSRLQLDRCYEFQHLILLEVINHQKRRRKKRKHTKRKPMNAGTEKKPELLYTLPGSLLPWSSRALVAHERAPTSNDLAHASQQKHQTSDLKFQVHSVLQANL